MTDAQKAAIGAFAVSSAGAGIFGSGPRNIAKELRKIGIPARCYYSDPFVREYGRAAFEYHKARIDASFARDAAERAAHGERMAQISAASARYTADRRWDD